MDDAVAERLPPAAGTASESFEALYRSSFTRVYAYVASLLRDRATAEDVTAQAFERAFRKRRGRGRAVPRRLSGRAVLGEFAAHMARKSPNTPIAQIKD